MHFTALEVNTMIAYKSNRRKKHVFAFTMAFRDLNCVFVTLFAFLFLFACQLSLCKLWAEKPVVRSIRKGRKSVSAAKSTMTMPLGQEPL